jgi:fimbrial chaperone protein
MTVSSMRTLMTAVLATAVLTVASAASAATFSVNPTQLHLSRGGSTLLTLRNDSTDVLRFQLTVFGWTQSPSGEIELAATNEVVFFPALLTLQPQEERRIRIGYTGPPAERERTFRVFVEELPPADAAPGAVRMLTKMGVPIFVAPARPQLAATLSKPRLETEALAFDIENRGNVHFVPQQIRVRGTSADGAPVLEQEIAGWYILAGGRRSFVVPVGADLCRRAAQVSVEFDFGPSVLRESVTPAAGCGK